MTIATIKVMFHERVSAQHKLQHFFTKMVFVQVISLLLHFALLYFPLKKMFHFAPVLLHFEFKSCYILGKKLLQFAFICVKSYKAA